MTQRNERIDLRVDHSERAMVTKLAARDGVTVSTWIRSRIRAEFRAHFGDAQPRMPKGRALAKRAPKTETP